MRSDTSRGDASIHGHNRRMSLENVRLGTQVLFELVRRIAT